MEDNSDRAAAITIFALFDDLLLKVMQEHFDPDIPGGFDSIFHPSAFLGTAHNRLKLALALRWVEKTTYQDINLLRSIRNRFAHHIEAKTFDDARMAGYITSLSENDRDRNELEQVEPRNRFIYLSVKIFMTFVIQITTFPYSLILGISSRDILGNYENLPENLKTVFDKLTNVLNGMLTQG